MSSMVCLGREPATGGARRAGAGGPAVRQPARTLSAAAQGGRTGLTSPARPAGVRARPGCRRWRRPDGQARTPSAAQRSGDQQLRASATARKTPRAPIAGLADNAGQDRPWPKCFVRPAWQLGSINTHRSSSTTPPHSCSTERPVGLARVDLHVACAYSLIKMLRIAVGGGLSGWRGIL
jgi:hypothetical protein